MATAPLCTELPQCAGSAPNPLQVHIQSIGPQRAGTSHAKHTTSNNKMDKHNCQHKAPTSDLYSAEASECNPFQRKGVGRQSCRNKAPTSKAHYAKEHKWKGKKLPKQGTDQQSTRRGRKRVERQSCRNKAPTRFLDSADAVECDSQCRTV